MTEFGDLDGQFRFYAVVTPDGKIPTVGEGDALNAPDTWYTAPIGTLAHLSDYALVFADWDDANADYQLYRDALPAGSKIRAYAVAVEEVDNPYEGVEDARS